jgi:hypothetical protein
MGNMDWMILLLYALIGSVVWGVWNIYGLIRKGFNEVISGLESIDERLAKLGGVSEGKTK